jgi:hypothetical protein
MRNTRVSTRYISSALNIGLKTYSTLCLLLLFSTVYQVHAFAESRLAVLELQGEVGTITQRQAWTDSIRSAAIKVLRGADIAVIDRDQFRELLDPQRDLSQCVGLCAAELAREVGAHWSLSGSLVTEPNGVHHGSDRDQVLFTLKLHSASGALMEVKQVRGDIAEVGRNHIPSLTQDLLQAVFKPLESNIPESVEAHRDPDHPSVSPRDDQAAKRNEKPVQEVWTVFPTDSSSAIRCVSPLISSADYQQCVASGTCQPVARWGRCRVTSSQPVRCVNLQQALQYSQWRGAALLTVHEWRTWIMTTKYDTGLYEWLSPSSESESTDWREKILTMNRSSLKSASPLFAFRYAQRRAQRGEKIGRVKSRRSPPAFQVTDLSFRIVTTSPSDCLPE